MCASIKYMNTEYVTLTELWKDGEFLKVGEIINQEKWQPNEVAEFCFYFCKYIGIKDFEVLHKFL